MSKQRHIDQILREWPFEAGDVNARLVKGQDGRQVLQMRIDMGVLQLEIAQRPDGDRPHGADTYFDYLKEQAVAAGEDFRLSEEQCGEADREFVQFYQRRICWLSLREYRRAVRDADHSLAFMDFVKAHSPDEQWTMSHEQYRPFILFHRAQASALAALDESGAEEAIEKLNQGLARIRLFFVEMEAEERFDEDDLVDRLKKMRESLREYYKVGKTLKEQLVDAVASEQYELAAKLRDRIAQQEPR